MKPDKKQQNNKQQYRVNEQIRVREVRIVDENGSSVMPTRQALDIARQQGVDLVEISPNAQPPVCRIIDYSKFLLDQAFQICIFYIHVLSFQNPQVAKTCPALLLHYTIFFPYIR